MNATRTLAGSFSRLREKAGDEGRRANTLTPTLSRTREREQHRRNLP